MRGAAAEDAATENILLIHSPYCISHPAPRGPIGSSGTSCGREQPTAGADTFRLPASCLAPRAGASLHAVHADVTMAIAKVTRFYGPHGKRPPMCLFRTDARPAPPYFPDPRRRPAQPRRGRSSGQGRARLRTRLAAHRVPAGHESAVSRRGQSRSQVVGCFSASATASTTAITSVAHAVSAGTLSRRGCTGASACWRDGIPAPGTVITARVQPAHGPGAAAVR